MEQFQKYFYTDDMMYYTGYLDNYTPDIDENSDNGLFQYAIVNEEQKLIGYLAYRVDWYSSSAYNFGLFSFDRGNPIVGRALLCELNKLINNYKLHRIEFRMIGGNPVEEHYDKFCEKYNGTKYILKDVFKDRHGKYRDSIIYEIILS